MTALKGSKDRGTIGSQLQVGSRRETQTDRDRHGWPCGRMDEPGECAKSERSENMRTGEREG